jgi:3',5'-cyclic-nucleotide phosphodiesterase/cAMP-specific phosphodiesterase 4/calcium/calmodulin-dependent 3',5'-cyclic nucleotide phosphodiesterase
VASAFEIMDSPDKKYDILENFSDENFKKFRHLMISLILSTDMASHFNKIAKFKNRVTA